MIPPNPQNERLKRQYADFLKHADGKATRRSGRSRRPSSAMRRSPSTPISEPSNQLKAKASKPIGGSELGQGYDPLSTVTSLKRSLAGWLSSRVTSENQPDRHRVPKSFREGYSCGQGAGRPADPELEQVLPHCRRHAAETAIGEADQALVAFMATRASATGAVDHPESEDILTSRAGWFCQSSSEVNTKFGKRIDTFLFPAR